MAELHKPIAVTEYRCFEQTCFSCGLKTKAVLPEQVIPGRSIGAELQSWLSYLHIPPHISDAKLEQMSPALFGIPSLPMFLVLPLLLRWEVPFFVALGLVCALTIAAYLLTAYLLQQFQVQV